MAKPKLTVSASTDNWRKVADYLDGYAEAVTQDGEAARKARDFAEQIRDGIRQVEATVEVDLDYGQAFTNVVADKE